MKIREINKEEYTYITNLNESYFLDFKSKDITPSKLTKTLSAFCNASGGEIYLGLTEVASSNGVEMEWIGFDNEEAANPFFQVFHGLDPMANTLNIEFLEYSQKKGLVLHIIASKSSQIISATDGKVYIRSNAQNLQLKPEDIDRLKYDKGIKSFEDDVLIVEKQIITNSERVIEFFIETIPSGEPEPWLRKQFLLSNDSPTVAGILLYSDVPQSLLPKRSAVKIIQYKTRSEAERDFLASNPETIEGPIYNLIYDSVDKIKEIIEGIERVGHKGMEKISYPQEAVHELLTNAVLHRDYSITMDVQVRIFDNRVEIESPGKLPGHVTIENIKKTQFARNPKIVRLINKFKNPPNKDVGEGINTAFEAMEKLRLKPPEFFETENSIIVILRHESLASPEQIVLSYLAENEEITNSIAREITGIKSENSMKNVFNRLKSREELEQTPKIKGKKISWRRPDSKKLIE